MKTLRVTLADIVGPTGTPNSTATVHARYVDTSGRGRDVHLTDGTIVVPVRRTVAPGTVPQHFDFDVYANDVAPVREVDYGHLVEVSWTVVAPTGAKSSGVKRVQITDSMASVVQLGLLATPTPVPPYTGGYSLPGHKHVVGDITATGTPSASTYLRGDGSWSTPAGGGGGGVSDHGALTGLGDDDHTQYALSDGTRGTFAAPLGADDNYVTDAEKVKLSNLSGTNTGDQVLPTWTTISGKPAVVAAGATQAAARTAIGAGTSSLVVGTGAGDAKAGNYQPTAANVSDSTTTGRALLTAADAAAARTALGLGTAATTAATAYATAAQGTLADSALQASTAQAINAQTGATYTLVAGDAGKVVTLSNAGAITLNAPGSVFTAGQRVDVVVIGAGMATVVGTSGATANGTPSLVSRAQWSAFTILWTSATACIAIGDMA